MLDRVELGRFVAASLLGEDVDDDGAVERLGIVEGRFDLADVVAVERAEVVDAEGLEERRRFEHLADGGLGGADAPLGELADPGQVLGQFLEALLAAHVGGVRPDPDEALGEPADGRGVGTAIVVEEDRDAEAAVPEVVESLEGHAAGHAAVADDGDDPATAAAGGLGGGQPVRVREHGRGVRVLNPVMGRLGAGGIPRQAAGLSQRVEVGEAAGQHLVDVGLVAGVPEDDVVGAVEGAVQGDRQLDGAEVGAQVSAGAVDRLDEAGADLGGQGAQLGGAEVTQVCRGSNRIEVQGKGLRSRGSAQR